MKLCGVIVQKQNNPQGNDSQSRKIHTQEIGQPKTKVQMKAIIPYYNASQSGMADKQPGSVWATET